MKFDLSLFESLNNEYTSKPIVPQPRSYAPAAVAARGINKARQLCQQFDLKGKKVLEIGCGRGEILHALARNHQCQCVGVDIAAYPEWKTEGPDLRNLKLYQTDLTAAAPTQLIEGPFDFIYSIAVWEHLKHPYTMLRAAKNLLKSRGSLYLVANLFPGPQASHCYRQVFFPWPHLLFTDEVFEQFYMKHHNRSGAPAWINKLTTAHYMLYFKELDLHAKEISFTKSALDQPFYERFENELSRYPVFDLERDFIHAHLIR
jgi:cyclopropane fatty-acyl-phospholipid synthase-like methyltransferase